MQLKLQRSQRAGGITGSTVFFCLDVRADYSARETANIDKYRLGKQVIYNSRAAQKHIDRAKASNDGSTFGYVKGMASLVMAKLNLNLSIESLGRGQHIECKDLDELLEAEEAVMEACRKLKQYLDTAASFNGSIVLIDFDDGEKAHIGNGTLELLSLPSPGTGQSLLPPSEPSPEPSEFRDWLESFDREQVQRLGLVAAGAVVLLLVLTKCM